MLERENRREKILEAKSRELKLKTKVVPKVEDNLEDRPKLLQCKCNVLIKTKPCSILTVFYFLASCEGKSSLDHELTVISQNSKYFLIFFDEKMPKKIHTLSLNINKKIVNLKFILLRQTTLLFLIQKDFLKVFLKKNRY